MEDILLLETIEKYLSGQMSAEEKRWFEDLRKKTPEIDQMVVEHNMFLHQMDFYADRTALKHTLQHAHQQLLNRGDINEGGTVSAKGRVIQLWNKYRRVTAIAASVGGGIALLISGLVAYFSPVNHSQIQQLSRDIAVIKRNQQYQGNLINEVKGKIPADAKMVGGGTGFLIDPKGYLVTNAHVVRGTSAVVVNSKGDEFKAVIAYTDAEKDIAILKIDDADFKAFRALPYGIRKQTADLGEEIFTLGYPRNEISYNLGYLSARTGFNGDSVSFQLQMSANPGSSGAPVLNKNGEVVGILSTRQATAEGVAFAVKSKNIYQLIDALKKDDTAFQKVKVATHSSLKGMNRTNQVKEMEDYVFLVKAFNKN
ncbi:MAG: serine protease [Chitinophagaceae bacterium]|nr:serine protease [Chitinophagaceae bacterium]